MRRITGMVVAAGIVAAAVAGCGITSSQNMAQKLKTEASALESTNYESTAMMTVQMDNSSQTYYIETAYDSSDAYRIKLGDANKNINQIIVKNGSGMFIVSPSLQKVFRFNGNWAQNQGHIYLYDQILRQLIETKGLKTTKNAAGYTFELPAQSGNDVVTKQQVTLDKNLDPKKVVLLDQNGKAVVTIDFKSFKQNVKFKSTDFDPHALISQNPPAKATMATGSNDIGYVTPANVIGDTLAKEIPQDQGYLLRYEGPHNFVLSESLPTGSSDAAFLDSQMVDLYGIPAVFSNISGDKELSWINNGMEFSLVSDKMTMNQMMQVASSTVGQVSK